MKIIDRIVIIIMLVLLACTKAALAEELLFDKSLKTYKKPPNIEQYFKEKYKNQIDEVKCEFQETPEGPKGRLYLTGRIELKNSGTISDNGDSRIRSIARSFLQEEAGVLGIVDVNEWRDVSIIWTTDYYGEKPKRAVKAATITLLRYFNGIRFESFGYGPMVSMKISENDFIHRVEAHLAPASTEVYKALTKKILPEEEAAKIVERKLTESGISFIKIPMDRLVIDKPPYVVWKSDGYSKDDGAWHWRLEIDAFSGKILFDDIKKFDCGDSHCGCSREVEVNYKTTILSSDFIPQPNINVKGPGNQLLARSDGQGKVDFTFKTISTTACGMGELTLTKETPKSDELWIIRIDFGPMMWDRIILETPYQKAERRNGENDGTWQEWCSSGQWGFSGKLRVSGNYKKGLKDGVWTTWNCTGEKRSQGEYKSGKREGTLVEWHANGHIYRHSEWHDGKLNGKFTVWFPDGQLMAEIEMRDNKPYGQPTYYSRDGKKILGEPPFEYLNLAGFPHSE